MSSVSLDFNIYSKKLQRLYIWYRNYTRFLQLFQFVLRMIVYLLCVVTNRVFFSMVAILFILYDIK